MQTDYTTQKKVCPSCGIGEFSFEVSGDYPPRLKSDYVTCSNCPNDHRIRVREAANRTWRIEIVETISRP